LSFLVPEPDELVERLEVGDAERVERRANIEVATIVALQTPDRRRRRSR
jgi:hypothetical protein